MNSLYQNEVTSVTHNISPALSATNPPSETVSKAPSYNSTIKYRFKKPTSYPRTLST